MTLFPFDLRAGNQNKIGKNRNRANETMKQKLILAFTLLNLICLGAVSALGAPATKGDLDGQWRAKVKSEYGDTEIRLLTVKGDQFTYEVQTEAGDTVIYGKGKLTYDQCPPFKLIKLTDIQGGNSKFSLQPISDTRTLIYFKSYRSFYLAQGFDGWHEESGPECVLFRQQDKQ